MLEDVMWFRIQVCCFLILSASIAAAQSGCKQITLPVVENETTLEKLKDAVARVPVGNLLIFIGEAAEEDGRLLVVIGKAVNAENTAKKIYEHFRAPSKPQDQSPESKKIVLCPPSSTLAQMLTLNPPMAANSSNPLIVGPSRDVQTLFQSPTEMRHLATTFDSLESGKFVLSPPQTWPQAQAISGRWQVVGGMGMMSGLGVGTNELLELEPNGAMEVIVPGIIGSADPKIRDREYFGEYRFSANTLQFRFNKCVGVNRDVRTKQVTDSYDCTNTIPSRWTQMSAQVVDGQLTLTSLITGQQTIYRRLQ
jgi:hypothetical protein